MEVEYLLSKNTISLFEFWGKNSLGPVGITYRKNGLKEYENYEYREGTANVSIVLGKDFQRYFVGVVTYYENELETWLEQAAKLLSEDQMKLLKARYK